MQMPHITNSSVIKAAANYLIDNNIPFVFPEKNSKETVEGIVVKFLCPEALNPNFVIDPPDMCLLVNPDTLEVEPLLQY